MGLIGFQCIVGQWRFDLQTFRLAATIPIWINSLSRGSTVQLNSYHVVSSTFTPLTVLQIIGTIMICPLALYDIDIFMF